MGHSKIPYLDAVYNPILGCDQKMPCSARCWAIKTVANMARNPKMTESVRFNAGLVTRIGNVRPEWSGVSALIESWLSAPLHWRKPQRIGVCFLGDLFAEAVPLEWQQRVASVMRDASQHSYYILTKRPGERMERIARQWGWSHSHNIRVGVSVCNQAEADERIPLLLQTPAAQRWISIEPMTGPVNLTDYVSLNGTCFNRAGMTSSLSWVVCGAESGPSRRPCPWSWVERVVKHCEAAGVKCWTKQLDYRSRSVIDTPIERVIHPGDPAWPAWAKQEQP